MTLGTSDTLEPEASTARIVVGIDGSDASIDAARLGSSPGQSDAFDPGHDYDLGMAD